MLKNDCASQELTRKRLGMTTSFHSNWGQFFPKTVGSERKGQTTAVSIIQAVLTRSCGCATGMDFIEKQPLLAKKPPYISYKRGKSLKHAPWSKTVTWSFIIICHHNSVQTRGQCSSSHSFKLFNFFDLSLLGPFSANEINRWSKLNTLRII